MVRSQPSGVVRRNEIRDVNLGIFVRGGASRQNLIAHNEAIGGEHGLLGICYNPASGQGLAGPQSDEVKSNFGNAPVKFIVEDEQGKPDTAVTKAKKLILQDKVHMLVGGLLASSGYALAPVSTQEKTVYVVPVAAADDLTQRDLKQYPYIVRTSWTSSQPHHPLGAWACENGYKTVVSVAADYAFGHEVLGGFQKDAEREHRKGRRDPVAAVTEAYHRQ